METHCWHCGETFTHDKGKSLDKRLHFVAGDAWVYICTPCWNKIRKPVGGRQATIYVKGDSVTDLVRTYLVRG